MPAASAQFPPQFIPQQPPQYFNGRTPAQLLYYTPRNQQIQQQPPTQTQNTAIQTNNINKPKPKRTSKIVIRDPKDNKDVTEEILRSGSPANGRTGGSPPVTNPNAQTDSSKIQAQFAAQVAARVGGEKGKQTNANGRTDGTPPLTDSTAQTDSSKIQDSLWLKFTAIYGGAKGKEVGEKKDTDKDNEDPTSTS